MIIKVKNMICQRCKIVVENILSNLGLEAEAISIGEIVLKRKVSDMQLKELDAALKVVDLELVYDKKNLIDQQIKTLVTETIYYLDEPLNIKFSCFLSSKLNYNYNYLSKIFSEVNGINIERYIILQKIEKVKSMLVSDDSVLSEIAFKMNYSSVSHLSNQFKKYTGVRASDYKSSLRPKSNGIYRTMSHKMAV